MKEQENCKGKKKFSWKKTLCWIGGGIVLVGGGIYAEKKYGIFSKAGKKVKNLLPGKKNVVVEESVIVLTPENTLQRKEGGWRRKSNNWSCTTDQFENHKNHKLNGNNK